MNALAAVFCYGRYPLLFSGCTLFTVFLASACNKKNAASEQNSFVEVKNPGEFVYTLTLPVAGEKDLPVPKETTAEGDIEGLVRRSALCAYEVTAKQDADLHDQAQLAALFRSSKSLSADGNAAFVDDLEASLRTSGSGVSLLGGMVKGGMAIAGALTGGAVATARVLPFLSGMVGMSAFDGDRQIASDLAKGGSGYFGKLKKIGGATGTPGNAAGQGMERHGSHHEPGDVRFA